MAYSAKDALLPKYWSSSNTMRIGHQHQRSNCSYVLNFFKKVRKNKSGRLILGKNRNVVDCKISQVVSWADDEHETQSPINLTNRFRNRRHFKLICKAASNYSSQPAEDSQVQTGVIIGCGFSLLLCNMCRVCMSVAIIPMSLHFNWTASTQGLIQSSFLWGYAATQILGGSLADRFGGKVVMAAGIVLFASTCAALPAAIFSANHVLNSASLVIPAVLLCRAGVGLGEGVTMPSMNNLLATHIPARLRARSIGAIFAGFHGGTLLGLMVSPWILTTFGWQTLFPAFGLLGIPLLMLWQSIVPSKVELAEPSDQPRDRTATVLPMLLTKPAVWAIIVANFVNHWGYFLYLNWMPIYFNRVLGFNMKDSTLASFLPWLVMASMSYLAGWIADQLVNRGVNRTLVRKAVQSVAFLGPAVALGPLVTTTNPGVAVACFTVAMAFKSFSQAGYLANMQDIAPRYAGRLFGLANTAGSLAGILGTAAAGILIEKTGSWAVVFQLMVGIYVFGLIVWNTLCTAEPIFDN